MNTGKREWIYPLTVSFSFSTVLLFINDTIGYELPVFRLFIISFLLFALPILLNPHQRRFRGILIFSALSLLWVGFHLLFPFFFRQDIVSFYIGMKDAALRTFKDELAGFPIRYQILIFSAGGFLLYLLGWILRNRQKASAIIVLAGYGALAATALITKRLPEPATLFFFVSGVIFHLLVFFYGKRIQLNKTTDREKSIFYIQSLSYALLFSLISLGLYALHDRPLEFIQKMELTDWARDRFADTMPDDGTVMFDPETGSIDLTTPFPDRKGTALEVRSLFPLYLKGFTLSVYDGKTWTPAEAGEEIFELLDGQYYSERDIQTIRVYYREIESSHLLLPPYTVSFETEADFQNGSATDDNIYSVRYANPSFDFWKAARESPADPGIGDSLIDLDAIPLSIQNLAVEVTEGVESPYQKARILEEYIRRNYFYSSRPPSAPEGTDHTEYFLFESHKGYCIHFASALTLLCRSSGIPARLVSGYVAQNSRELGDEDPRLFFTVSHRDAHAWVEVYFPETGWIPLDATPRYSSVYESYYDDQSNVLERTVESPEVGELNKADWRPLIFTVFFALILALPIVIPLFRRIIYDDAEKRAGSTFKRFIRLMKLYQVPYSPCMTINEIRCGLQDKKIGGKESAEYLTTLERKIYGLEDFRETEERIIEKQYRSSMFAFLKNGFRPGFLLRLYLGLI